MILRVFALFTCTVVSVKSYAGGEQNTAKNFTGAHTPKYAVAPVLSSAAV